MKKLVCLLVVLTCACSASAAFYVGNPTAANGWDTTSAVTALVSANPDYAVNLVNGSEMEPTGGALHGVSWRGMWWTSGTTPVAKYDAGVSASGPAWVAFEFDQAYTLDSMEIWNYSEHSGAGDLTGMGIKDCTIDYFDGTSWNVLGSFTLNQATVPAWNSTVTPADSTENAVDSIIGFGNATVEKVVITVSSTDGAFDGGSWYGLSEVRFATPEPASLALLTLGGLFLRRRR